MSKASRGVAGILVQVYSSKLTLLERAIDSIRSLIYIGHPALTRLIKA
jgi:hypothetical protein